MTRFPVVLIVLCLSLPFLIVADPERCEAQGISISKSLLESSIKQYYYASEDQMDIYLLTHSGVVYRSTNRGQTFLNKMNSFPQWNNESISYPSGHHGVKKIHGASGDHIVYFEGYGLSYWTTRGDDIYKLYTVGSFSDGRITGDYITKFSSNPYEPSTLLRVMYDSICFETDFEQCFQKTQVSLFQGADNSWNQMNDYTFKASWGARADQLFITTMHEEDRIVNQLDVPSLETKKILLATDAYGETVNVTVPKVVDFAFTSGALYFAKTDGSSVTPYVSTELSSANEMIFAGASNNISAGISFNVLHSDPSVSFVSVLPHVQGTFGNLFQSATDDARYWVSLENIRVNSNGVDFYRTLDLPGIYLANSYDADYTHSDDIEDHIQTKITFDQGGEWFSLQSVDGESDTHVNLFLNSEYTGQPAQSSENAAGIIYSLGNEGENRKSPFEDIALYLSRSGGRKWERVLDGFNYFSFNDHASLVVASESRSSTDILKYSWNQAMSWNECSWGELEPFTVRSIIPLTSDTNGLQFIVFGELDNEKGIAMYVDFVENIPRICEETTDYESFEPSVGDVCLLGESVSYIRRKRESSCVAPAITQEHSKQYSCECSRHDFQCDGDCFAEQHVEGELNTICVNICVGMENDPTLPPEDCNGEFLQTQGYRKVPGDNCEGGGEEFLPKLVSCDINDPSPSIAVTPEPTHSLTPSFSPKPSSETPSPTLSTKASESVTPSVTNTPPQSSSKTPSTTHSDEPSNSPTSSPKPSSASPSPTLSTKVSETSTTSETSAPSETSVASVTSAPSASIVPTSTATSTSTVTSEVDNQTSDVETSDVQTSGGETTGEETSLEESSGEENPGESKDAFFIPIAIGGSIAAGFIGVSCFVCVGVMIVVIKKKKTGRSKGARMYDEDVFSLEDNDEWEL